MVRRLLVGVVAVWSVDRLVYGAGGQMGSLLSRGWKRAWRSRASGMWTTTPGVSPERLWFDHRGGVLTSKASTDEASPTVLRELGLVRFASVRRLVEFMRRFFGVGGR